MAEGESPKHPASDSAEAVGGAAQAPVALEYHTPVATPAVRVPREQRVTLGCLVSFLWLMASLMLVENIGGFLAELMAFPLGWLAAYAHAEHGYDVELTPAIIANSVLWGFLIAFAFYRRKWFRRRRRRN